MRVGLEGTALSGATINPGYSIQGVSDLTGGAGAGVDTRVDFICDPNLPRGERSPTRAFRTECVAPPSAATNRVGTARLGELVGPRYLNWDITFAKNIPFGQAARAVPDGAVQRVQQRAVLGGEHGRPVQRRGRADQPGVRLLHRGAGRRRIQLTLRVDF